jgi:hypothetical protein
MNRKQIDSILFGIGVSSWNRFHTFFLMKGELKGKNYWYALRNSYDCSDNLYKAAPMVKAAFLSKEPGREYLMSKKERDYLTNLPDRITIYRGMTEKELKKESFGVSWTLKKEVAEFFANTYIRNFDTRKLKKCVYELTINKNDVIAFFNERKEFEIIYIHPKA